jgi:perosamine synthetase
MTKIELFKPLYGEEEIAAFTEAIKSNWWTLGPRTAKFEKEFAAFLGCEHVVALNSCTAALDLALKLLGVTDGDEVLVPALTFISTAHAVVYNRATPIFCDIDPDTLLLSIPDVKKKITHKTKAVMAVHYGGRCIDIAALREAIGPNIFIVEDCAHACGSKSSGSYAGTMGDIGCFSFHAVKNLATGDGGAITTNDRSLATRAKKLRWLGIDKGTWDRTDVDKSYWWEYQVDEIGYKYHMNDLTASLASVQLTRLSKANERRAEIAAIYSSQLGSIGEIRLPIWLQSTAHDINSWHLYPVRTQNRDGLSMHLKGCGITTGVHYKPIHLYKCYGYQSPLPVVETEWKKLLSLPMHPCLSDEEATIVCAEIKGFYGR